MEAPAAASNASSQPASTSTTSSRVPTTPSTPGQQLRPGGPPGFVQCTLEGVGPGHRAVQLLFGLAKRLLGGLQVTGGLDVGRLGLGHGRLQPVTSLLGLGLALRQLVLLAFEETRPPFGVGRPGPHLVERPPVPVEGVLEGGQTGPGPL
jgi:hypothetical protein